MKSVRLLSTGSYLPGEPITNAHIEAVAGPLPPDILEGIQVQTRHWILDLETGAHRENNQDLAYKAAKQALELAHVEPGEVDLIVLSTASPDTLLPPVVTFVQERLGLDRCATLEVRSGCAGAVEAMDVARLYLERGQYRTAVVIGSETISPLLLPVFRGKGPDKVRMRDRLALYNFGDGAGAMVLRAFDDGQPGMLGSAIACVGGGKKAGMEIVGGGTQQPIHEQLKKAGKFIELKVDVVESGRHTPHVLTEALAEMVKRTGVKAEAIDLCVIPEGNAGYMTDELKAAGLLTPEWLAVAPKIYENLALVGATGSAAGPLALDHAWKTGRVKVGDKVMLLAIETSKWKYAGMVFNWTAPPLGTA
jgi:3-oxoacyl-[acyl-carrier-protein] synthase III